MKKLLLLAVFSVLFIFPAHADAEEVTFISSEADLNDALGKTKIKGIAVRGEFYDSAGPVAKSQIGYLINMNLNKLVPVFFYGYGISADTAKILLRESDNFRCRPLIMAGIFWTLKLNSADIRGEHERMCVTGKPGAPGSDEEWFREWIEKDWLQRKSELKDLGYATLN